MPKQFVRSTGSDTPPANAPPESAHASDLRVWTDITGQHKVESDFVELIEGKVTLRKKDGSLSALAVERLCKDDQVLIASLAEGVSEASPEDMLRQFLLALAGGDRRRVASSMLPHPNAAIVFQGAAAPPQVVEQMAKQLEAEEVRRLKLGDKVSLPGGDTMVVDRSRFVVGRREAARPPCLPLAKGTYCSR